jgi:hypothetical protein
LLGSCVQWKVLLFCATTHRFTSTVMLYWLLVVAASILPELISPRYRYFSFLLLSSWIVFNWNKFFFFFFFFFFLLLLLVFGLHGPDAMTL